MKTYTVAINPDWPFWWWHVLYERKSGWRLTEKGARKAAAKAIRDLQNNKKAERDFERWTTEDAAKVLSK